MKSIFASFLIVLLSAPAFAQGRETRNVSDFTKISFRHSGKLYLKQGSPQKVELEGDKDILKEIETEVEGDRLIIGREGKWNDWSWGDSDKAITVYITVPNIEGVSVAGSGDIIGQGKIKANDIALAVSGSGSMHIEVDASGDMDTKVSGSGDLEVSGSARSVESDVSGSGKIEMALMLKELADFSVSGSGKIFAKGSVNRVKTSISGSGKVLAADLEANRCEIRISGSGDVEINVKTELDATISGSGSVSYKGNPSKVNSHASGSGKVRKM